MTFIELSIKKSHKKNKKGRKALFIREDHLGITSSLLKQSNPNLSQFTALS